MLQVASPRPPATPSCTICPGPILAVSKALGGSCPLPQKEGRKKRLEETIPSKNILFPFRQLSGF